MSVHYSLGARCVTEILGTAAGVYVGEASIANALLPSAKGQGMGFGWIAFAYALAFFFPCLFFGHISAIFNPAFCMGLLAIGQLSWREFLALSAAEVLGGFLGGVLVWLHWIPHLKTVPEAPSLCAEDHLIRKRDSITKCGVQIASYNTPTRRSTGVLGCFTDIAFYLSHHHLPDTLPSSHRHSKTGDHTPPHDAVATAAPSMCPPATAATLQLTAAELHQELCKCETECLSPREHETPPRPPQHPAAPAPTPIPISASATSPALEHTPTPDAHTAADPLLGHQSFNRLSNLSAPSSTSSLTALLPPTPTKPQTHLSAPAAAPAAALPSHPPAPPTSLASRQHPGSERQRQKAQHAYQAALVADQNIKLSIFATRPAIYAPVFNFLVEFLSTVLLVGGIMLIQQHCNGLRHSEPLVYSTYVNAISPFYVGLWVVVLVLGVGGPTGLAVNPARDLGPRMVHAVLPIPNKGPTEWHYAWIPVVAPLLGGACGAALADSLRHLR